jgi:hypothetical protein
MAARTEMSNRLEVDCRHLALLATLEVEADLLPLVQAAEASTLDRADMNEYVLRAVTRLNEAVSLLGIKPLDRAFRHRVFSLHFGDPPVVDRNAFHLGAPKRDEAA